MNQFVENIKTQNNKLDMSKPKDKAKKFVVDKTSDNLNLNWFLKDIFPERELDGRVKIAQTFGFVQKGVPI